jgi:hypothetical protein
MNDTSNRFPYAPDGWHTVTPRIVAHGAQQLVEFIKHVSGQQETIGQTYHP